MSSRLREASNPRAGQRAHQRNLVLLWAGQFVNTTGLMMLVPVMPFYLRDIGMGEGPQLHVWAGVAIAAPALALTLVTPLWGRLGDRVGRKWMMVRALLGLALAMTVMAAATTPLMLVLGRLIQGLLGGVVEAAAAFAGAAGPRNDRGSTLGKSFSATAAGALLGPVAGGVLIGGSLNELMLVLAAVAGALALLCAWALTEPAPIGSHRDVESRESRRRSAFDVPGATALAIAATAAYFGSYGLIPLFAEHINETMHFDPTASAWVGVLHSTMWSATLAGSLWWGRRNDAHGTPLRTFTLAAGVCGLCIIVLGFPLGPVASIPFRLIQGFFFAALAQSLFMHFARHAPEDATSAFVGTVNSFLLIGQSAGPLLTGVLTWLLPGWASVVVMGAVAATAALISLGPARMAEHGRVDPRTRAVSGHT